MRMKDRMKRFLMEVLGLREEGLVERIIGISCIKHYTKGRTLYNQGEKVDACGFLMEGVIGAFIYTKSGKQITDDFSYLPGEMITPLADKKKRALTSAVALTEVDAFVIPNMDAEALFKAYPELHHLLFFANDAMLSEAMGIEKYAVSDGGEGKISFLFRKIQRSGGCSQRQASGVLFGYVAGDAEPTETEPAGEKARLKKAVSHFL